MTPDRDTQQLARTAEQALGDLLGTTSAYQLDGVRHTWANCPFGGGEEPYVIPPHVTVTPVTLVELFDIDDCSACTLQTRPDGGIARWVRNKLRPITALDATDAGTALNVCHPTSMIPEAAVALLLDDIRRRFTLTPHLEGPVCAVDRATTDGTLLITGVHAPDGTSVITAAGRATTIGEADPDTGVAVAEAFLTLRHTFNDPNTAWATLNAAHQTPQRLHP
jgi:hypothetical protein